ncbi:MAG: B12-binding domain-containing radical SAM protein [Thermodesulfobacteriota bacterium]
MKILLIQPPLRDFYQTSIRTQPIGLAYLASSLQSHGHEVEILDCQTHQKRYIPIPPELSYLKDFYPFEDRSPFKLFSGFYHFGMGWEEIRKKILDSKADVFGISSNFTPYHGEALEVARIIKEFSPKKIVVMGGSHVSGDPERVLQNPFIDYVLLGEGEIRFPLLLKVVEKGVNQIIKNMEGLGYRWDGEVRINPLFTFIQDLDSLPYPARGLLDLDQYQIKKKRSTVILTSRGCPHGCAYCSTHLVMGNSFRAREPERIVEEMMECYKRYGMEAFDIEDDNFTFDLNRAKRLMKLITKNFGEERLELYAMNGVSFSSLDKALLKLMKRAGFRTINLSFVSTSVLTRDRMGRPSPKVEFDRILEKVEQVGLNVIAYVILGMPGQTIEEMVDTIIYLMGKRVLIGPSIYYPTPGTSLFKRCEKNGILPPHSTQWRSSALPIETNEFNRIDLVTLFRLTRMVNFLKGRMDKGELSEGITLREIYQFVKDKAEVKTLDEIRAWNKLLLIILEERTFFGIRKESNGKTLIFKEPTSRKVLDYFFEKGLRRPILRSHSVIQ